MTELTRQHDDLASMMGLMCDEICQNVRDVERQVAPHVGFRWRHATSGGDAELEERFNAFTTPLERRHQFLPRYFVAIDRAGNRDSVFPAESLEPHATGVMQMFGDHADRAPRRTRNRSIPECRGYVLDKVRSDSAVGPPGSQKRRALIVEWGHLRLRHLRALPRGPPRQRGTVRQSAHHSLKFRSEF